MNRSRARRVIGEWLLLWPKQSFYLRSRSELQGVPQQRQLALPTSETPLQSFLDATPDAVLVSNAEGVITMANRNVMRLLGYSPDELLGQSIDCLLPEGLRSGHPALRDGFAKRPHARRMGPGLEVLARHKDGSEFSVEVNLGRFHTELGAQFVSTVRDISRVKAMQEQLRIAAAAFESETSTMITDQTGTVLMVNRAFTLSTGYSAEEIVGQNPSMLSSGRHSKAFYQEMWRVIECEGNWQGEVWDRRKNGEVYPKWLSISEVKNDAGTVTHYVGTHQDTSEKRRSEERIIALAFFDPLTSLPNRTLLLDRLKQTVTGSASSARFGALLFVDLDNFKTLNDTLGHDMGDLLLQQVAKRLQLCVREDHSVARLGGDEFVIVLDNLGLLEPEAAVGARTVAEKCLAALSAVYLLSERTFQCTASIGLTLFCGDKVRIDQLMKQADLAMYKAKESGRNTVCLFDPDMELALLNRVALNKDLREAVESEQLFLHYQAQVDDEGRVLGAEVLVRWQHPCRGMVSPADFIPLAEETGLILPLGDWVLKTSCMQLARWAGLTGMAHLTLSVNVSARQFAEANFVAKVIAVLQSTGANPERLKLELTESLLVGDVQAIIKTMFALKAQGISFSLDDFGTGYSSLTYLKRLPLDQLKIDQSFVHDVLVDDNDAAIARTIVTLAQSLGLGVIAEGVETPMQRDFLARAGCRAYQGYFFSRPLPLQGFETFCAANAANAASWLELSQPESCLS